MLRRPHRNDLEVLRGHAFVAVLPGHPLALEDTAGERPVAARAAMPEVFVRAVTSGKAPEAMTLDDTGVATALGRAGDVNTIACFEYRLHRNFLAHCVCGTVLGRKFSEDGEHALTGFETVLAK